DGYAALDFVLACPESKKKNRFLILTSLQITENFSTPVRVICPPAGSTMATPFPQVIKIEDESNATASDQQVRSEQDQMIMDMFRKGVQRQVELRRKARCASGSAYQPPPPPPVSTQYSLCCSICIRSLKPFSSCS